MALELSSIVFKASTDELDAAVKKIETLGKSVEGLASSLGKLDKETSAANKTQAQANLLTAKAATETAKAATETAKANAIVTKAQDQNTAATERLTRATKERQSVEERQAAITRLMAEGNSRGQASILATAEALGEATEKTNEYLKAQRAMSSNNPFDRSLGAATVFANELKVATVASDLYNKDLGFTKNQLQELGREHVRLTEQFKVQGKSLSGLDTEFNKIVQSAQQVTQAENAMASSMKNADKATMDAGKANAYIENELQKVRFALQANNEELNRSTSNSLVRFENALKKSGLTLDQQKVKIDEYRKAQVELQKTTSSNQTDYITRAVGPQITDIIVGLSTGQSPLTVMMQQGGQLRDQFGMMGIAAKDMGDVMRNAMKGMAQSVFDTGKAIGSMLVGGIYDAGKAVVNLGMDITGMNSVLEYSKKLLAAQGEEGFKYIGMLNRAGAVVTGVLAVGIAAGVLSVLALGIAFVQVTKAQDDLTKSLVSSGAQLGLSSTDAITLAESLRGVGATSVEILTAFKQISDSGNISRESLVAVAEAALILENAGGKAASKTIEMFAKLADKPMETLSEYAQKTGLVDQAEMQRIETLVKLGKEITATEEATKILAKATEDEAAIMLASLSDVSRLWLTVKAGISEAWRAVQEFAGSKEVMSGVKVVLQTVAVIATEVWYGIKGIGESLGGLGAIAAAVMTDIKNLDTNFTASKGMLNVIEEQDKARATSYNDSIARIMQEGKYSREELNKTAALAATGRKADADAEKDRVAHELAMKPWREQEQKSLADNLTKQEFIKQAIDKTNKALTEGKTLRAEEIAQITKLAGADWDKSNKPKKAKLSDEQKAENKALEDYIDLMNKSVGLNKDYNNILDGLQLRRKNNKITEEEYVKAVEELIKQQKFYTDGLAQEEKAQKAAQKAAADHMKLVEEFTKIQTEFTATSLKNQEGIQQENSALSLRVALLGKTEEEQKKINESYKAQGDISKINAKYDKERLELQQKYLKLQADGFDVDYDVWNKQIQQSVQQQGEEAKLVWAGVAMNAAESMQKEFDAIKSSITDVITTALFDGGKAGSKKLRDQVVQAFRNKITVVIDAVVNTALTELFSGATGGSTGGAGAGQAGSGILGAISTGKSFVDALSGSMNTAIATSFGKFASTGMGQSLGLSTSVGVHGPVTAAGASPTMLTSTGTMLQGAMASAAGIAAGLALNKAISGGYSVGKGMDNWQKVGTVIAGAINPALGAIVGAIGGLVNRAFGRKLTETGIQGTFGGEAGFSGEGYKFEKGGWFRSDKTSTSAIDPALQSGLAQQFNAIKSSVGFMATMLGQGTDAISSFTASIKLNFKDLSEDESTKLLQKEFNKISESLAGLALGTTQYNRTGETNVETLTRLHTSLLTANSALTVLGGYLFDVSLVGADASQVLIDLMGGVQQFTSTMGDYYQNFYTEEERTATSTNNLVSEFAKLNITMPAINESTRAWYRSEVERLGAMDLSVDANARAYASILGLQGAVNQLAPAFDAAGTAASTLSDVLKSLNDKTIDLQIDLLTAQGKTSAAAAAIRARDIAGYTALELAAYDYNSALTAQINATNAAAAANQAFNDAQKAIADDTLDIIAQISNVGKSDFDKQIAAIISGGAKKQTEFDKLSSAQAAANSALATSANLATAAQKLLKEETDKVKKALDDATKATTKTTDVAVILKDAIVPLGGAMTDTANAAAAATKIASDAAIGANAALKTASDAAAAIAAIAARPTPSQGGTSTGGFGGIQNGLASGGQVYGPGTATSDSVPAMLSAGEFVVKASSVSKYGTDFLSAINEGSFSGTRRLSAGGSASDAYVEEMRQNEANRVEAGGIVRPITEGIIDMWRELYDTSVRLTDMRENIGAGSGEGYAPGNTQTPASGGGTVTDNTAAQLLLLFKEQRQTLLKQYGVGPTSTEAKANLLAKGFDVTGKDEAGIKKYFADLAAAADVTTEAGRKTIQDITNLADSIGSLGAVAQERKGLQDQINSLTDTSVQALARQRNALDETNRTLFDQVQALKAQDLSKQATADYNLAMAEATGNTVSAAKIQRDLADATKLAAGWTQAQIDALNTVLDANKLKDAITAMESARVSVASAFKAIEETAKNAQAAVDAAKEGITQGYLNALDQQKQAQENINSLIRQSAEEMRGFANGIKDFLLQMATTDLGADTKAQQLKALQADFLATAGLARGGDTKAYGSITGKAQSLLTAGKEQFSTQAEFARFSSSVANTLAELQTLADGKAGPLAEAVDPMIQAQADLLKANQEVIRWTKAVNESGASTSITLKDYAEDWRKAQAANVKAQADLLAAQVLTQGIDLKLNDTLGELRGLLKTYHDAVTAMIQAGGGTGGGGTGGGGTGGGGTGGGGTPTYTSLEAIYQSILGRAPDTAGAAYWQAWINSGSTLSEIATQILGSTEAQRRTPGFAVGTNYVPYDMNANIHAGERIIPAADNTELMQRLSSPMIQDNSELVLEIQRLNSRLATIESNTASTAGHAAKTARLLDRAMPDGDALATRTAEAI